MIISKNFLQSSSRLAFRDWDYCRHNYCTFLHACQTALTKFGLQLQILNSWSPLMIELIYKNNKQTFYFTGNRTEMIGSAAPGISAKTVGCRKFFSIVSHWAAFLSLALETDITMEISKHLTSHLVQCLTGLLMEYQFIILYLLPIWDKRSGTW